MAYKIATEDYAYNLGNQDSPINYKFCTKTRAEELGCSVLGTYADNLWVVEKDLTDALYIKAYYDIKVAIIYNPADSSSTTSTTVEYSTDYSTWTLFTMSTDGSSYITVSKGNKIYLRGNNSSGFSSSLNYVTILITPSGVVSADLDGAEVGGDLRYLLSYDKSISTIPNDYCFGFLFEGSTALSYADNLKLKFDTMSNFCYAAMFKDCTILRELPSLYSLTLTMGCYYHMYHGCAKISSIDSQYFTRHTGTTEVCKANCYEGMFHGCTSLVNPPDLLSTSLSPCCYRGMYRECSSLIRTGALVSATITYACYESMYEGCTSLLYVPSYLNATNLSSTIEQCINDYTIDVFKITAMQYINSNSGAVGAYTDMFKDCISLEYAPAIAISTFSNSITGIFARMFNGCSSLKQLAYNWTWASGVGATYCANWIYGTPDSGVTYYGNACPGTLAIPYGPNTIKSKWTRGGDYTSYPINTTYQNL